MSVVLLRCCFGVMKWAGNATDTTSDLITVCPSKNMHKAQGEFTVEYSMNAIHVTAAKTAEWHKTTMRKERSTS